MILLGNLLVDVLQRNFIFILSPVYLRFIFNYDINSIPVTKEVRK